MSGCGHPSAARVPGADVLECEGGCGRRFTRLGWAELQRRWNRFVGWHGRHVVSVVPYANQQEWDATCTCGWCSAGNPGPGSGAAQAAAERHARTAE